MDKLFIIIPSYNEEESIDKVVLDWSSVVNKVGNGSRLLVINDGSKDRTLDVLSRLSSNISILDVVNKTNSGHGPSCLFGYELAIQKGADFIFQTDSDGQTLVSDFWKFWELRKSFDFLFGFRTSRGDGIFRWIISKILCTLIFIIFGIFVKDANVPFRLMKSEKLKKYLDIIPNNFFLANALLTILLVKNSEKIKWINIGFKNRFGGVPSVSFKRFFNVGIKVIKDFVKFKKAN